MFERGFVRQLSVRHTSAHQTNWDRVLWATPLQELSLSSVEEAGEALRHPATVHLRRLGLFSCELAEQDILTLLIPARLPRLEALAILPQQGRVSLACEERLRTNFGPALVLELEPDRSFQIISTGRL
jgi:hypothetical protein